MTHSVAVVGSGMAGLAAAYFCRLRGYQVTVFEARDHIGMDAHAMEVHDGLVDVPLRVMSPTAWQSVLGLAASVGVETFPVDTYVSCSWPDQTTWFRSGRLPLVKWPFVGSWRYLNRSAVQIALGLKRLREETQLLSTVAPTPTLADFLQRVDFDPLVWRGLILPILTTICTCEEEHLLNWPAGQLLSLLDTVLHGGQLVRVCGGTSALVNKLQHGLKVNTDSPIQHIKPAGGKVHLKTIGGNAEEFDAVFMAIQANQLHCLSEDFAAERQLLGDIRFDSGELVVHTDERFMPANRRDWTTLNFQMDKALTQPMFSVWVNQVEPSLQNKPPIFQTWNPAFEPREHAIVARIPMQRAVVHAGNATVHEHLQTWHQQPGRNLFYCGSWAYSGVPLLESAVRSAQAAVDAWEVSRSRI